MSAVDARTRTQLDKAIAYLANAKKSNLKLRQGILHGSRVAYFKGKSALSALPDMLFLNPACSLSVDDADALADPSISSAATPSAQDTLEALLLHHYIVRVDKQNPKSKKLTVTPLQSFDAQDYYVLLNAPTSYTQLMLSAGLVAVVLAGVMYPLWPDFARIGVWYLSMGAMSLLGALFVLAILRLVVFVALLATGKPGWLFPNLFADVGVIDSFKPFWAWQAPATTVKGKKSASVMAAVSESNTITTAPLSSTPTSSKLS